MRRRRRLRDAGAFRIPTSSPGSRETLDGSSSGSSGRLDSRTAPLTAAPCSLQATLEATATRTADTPTPTTIRTRSRMAAPTRSPTPTGPVPTLPSPATLSLTDYSQVDMLGLVFTCHCSHTPRLVSAETSPETEGGRLRSPVRKSSISVSTIGGEMMVVVSGLQEPVPRRWAVWLRRRRHVPAVRGRGAVPYPTLPYPTLPHPTLPHPTLPYPTLHHLT